MIFVKHGQKMRNDDVYLEFGKPHAEARMPSGAPTHIPIWHFLVLGALGEVARRVPLIWVGIDSRILMGRPEMICLGRKRAVSRCGLNGTCFRYWSREA
jgi:hypothetical protein